MSINGEPKASRAAVLRDFPWNNSWLAKRYPFATALELHGPRRVAAQGRAGVGWAGARARPILPGMGISITAEHVSSLDPEPTQEPRLK